MTYDKVLTVCVAATNNRGKRMLTPIRSLYCGLLPTEPRKSPDHRTIGPRIDKVVETWKTIAINYGDYVLLEKEQYIVRGIKPRHDEQGRPVSEISLQLVNSLFALG